MILSFLARGRLWRGTRKREDRSASLMPARMRGTCACNTVHQCTRPLTALQNVARENVSIPCHHRTLPVRVRLCPATLRRRRA